MNQKKAKGLRKQARELVRIIKGNPANIDTHYDKLKKRYKSGKGQV
jgi:Txe/YoeB family toxin of Txe-Axe toxin-antitoxin module